MLGDMQYRCTSNLLAGTLTVVCKEGGVKVVKFGECGAVDDTVEEVRLTFNLNRVIRDGADDSGNDDLNSDTERGRVARQTMDFRNLHRPSFSSNPKGFESCCSKRLMKDS